jgi:response regulator RpfG family c-di-GMP phosphodiesterase
MMIVKDRPTSVYIIDDQPLDNIIVEMLIKRVDKEIDVNIINNGESAINKLIEISQSEPKLLPDYIFLDINMPGMDGWQFLSEYARLKMDQLKKTRIYILSSSFYHEDITRSHSNPLVVDFISKPFKLENLRTILMAA